MFKYVTVGGVVVGTFTDAKTKTKILRSLAPNIGASTKKGYAPVRTYPKKRSGRSATRQQKPRLGSYERITFLKPGDFKL